MKLSLGRGLLAAYACLLLASHAWMLTHPPPRRADPAASAHRVAVELSAFSDDGPTAGHLRVSVLVFGRASDPRPPLILLHGSPGSARNFEALGRRLGKSGRRCFAIDLPGFGRTTGDLASCSILAHARCAWAVADALGVERVHLAAWSMGGGVALHMADLQPERVASLSLIASIGVQRAEGSGSYLFEHAKYAVMGFGLIVLPELVPHFGALGPYGRGLDFVRNFWDSDQRPLEGIMRRLETPTLILHGRDDFLVPVWAAERSHELIGPSRLELSPAGHFLVLGEPFGQLDWTLGRLEPFLARHDPRGVPGERARTDDVPSRRGAERLGLEPFTVVRLVPWWVQFPVLVALAAGAPLTVACAAGALVAGMQLDFGLAGLACLLGTLVFHLRAGSGGLAPIRGLRRLGATCLGFLGVLLAGLAAAHWIALPAPQWLAPCTVFPLLLRRRPPRAVHGPGRGRD